MYCIQDKDGHCQNRHVSYFEPGGGDGGGDGGGSGGDGSIVGSVIVLFVILGLFVWGLIAVSDYMSAQIGRDAAAYTTPVVYRGAEIGESANNTAGQYASRGEIEESRSADLPTTSRWVEFLPGIELSEDRSSINFSLRSDRKIASGRIELPSGGVWSKSFIFPEDVTFDCVIVSGGQDIIYIDNSGQSHTKEDCWCRFASYQGRYFKVRPHESNSYMHVSVRRL